jgi:hypothetical protein
MISERYVTNAKGKRVSVILSYRDYRKLLEDIHDLAVAAERRDESPISFSEMKKRLNKDETA